MQNFKLILSFLVIVQFASGENFNGTKSSLVQLSENKVNHSVTAEIG